MFTVYLHLNRLNGKGYVGYTSETMHRRWMRHVNAAQTGNSYPFRRAIRKHGAGDDVWLHKELFCCDDEQVARNAEVFWIAELNTNHCNGGHGYNMTDGGEGRTGFKHTPDALHKMRMAWVGRPKRVYSPTARHNIAEALRRRRKQPLLPSG